MHHLAKTISLKQVFFSSKVFPTIHAFWWPHVKLSYSERLKKVTANYQKHISVYYQNVSVNKIIMLSSTSKKRFPKKGPQRSAVSLTSCTDFCCCRFLLCSKGDQGATCRFMVLMHYLLLKSNQTFVFVIPLGWGKLVKALLILFCL